MRFLAIDVGMGTQDILLYDSTRSIENCCKMVLPSQTQIIAKKIAKCTERKKNIVLVGETMGGGPCSTAVWAHIKADLGVYATERAALTLNDDLEKVMSSGVQIVSEQEASGLKAERIEMCDVDRPSLEKMLALFGIEVPERFAVAVQDHGYSPYESNRVFRFDHFRDLMQKEATLDTFVYRGNNIPPRFTRMKAVERTLQGALLMDTGAAAIRGALLDENARSPYITVNIGNGHTLAWVLDENRPVALFEHHTYAMTARKIDDYLKRLCSGTLDFKEVFEDGGHGCYVKKAIGFENIGSILVTGPRRSIMRDSQLKIHFAAPFGDMMLTGCFGLMDAYLKDIDEYNR